MRDWSKIDRVTVFKGFDENGNRYLTEFLKDYHTLYGGSPNAGCGKCLNSYYDKMITKKNTTMSKYRLKKKYDGISLGFGSNVIVSNRNMTDEKAKQLIATHPRGKELFDKLPEDSVSLEDKSRKELDALAVEKGLEPKDYSNKAEVIKAIESVE